MKRLMISAVAALALSACATATPYQPLGYSGSGGYAEQRLESNRYMVTFAGNSVTSRDTVEMYMLYRAAELTVRDGYDWFATVNRETDRDSRYVSSPDPTFGSRYGPYWNPYWRFYRGGYWSPWDPYWGRDMDVREITRYEATAEIVMGRGSKPADDPNAFNAREVLDNLAARVSRPYP